MARHGLDRFNAANGCRRRCRTLIFFGRASVCRLNRHDRFAGLGTAVGAPVSRIERADRGDQQRCRTARRGGPGLGSSPKPAFLHDAVALVSESARRARCRLQFYRFAYGFSRAPRSPARRRTRSRAAFSSASQDHLRLCRGHPDAAARLAEAGLQSAVGRGRCAAARRPSGFDRSPAQPRSGRRAPPLCPPKRAGR